MYRSSTGNLAYPDEPRGGSSRGGGERWDRDRFERMRRGGAPPEYDHYRYQEHDRYPGGHRDVDIHADYDRPRPRAPVAERERIFEDDRPSRRRTEIFDEPPPAEVANRALAPYRQKSVVDRDVDFAPRRPPRPQYIRRQSSLDTFDRRPLPRYGDYEKEEYRPPANLPIPLPIRERRRSPSRHYDDYDRYDDRDPGVEEYREVEVRRGKSKSRARRSRSRASRSMARSSVRSSSSSSFEEVSPGRASWGKKGKTRLPKRLAKKGAVIDLGYPFEEEDDFIIVKRALEKEHIDEIIQVSESYKETEKTTYVYEDRKTEIGEPPAPPPPPPNDFYSAPPPPPSVHHSSHHTAAPPPPPPPQSVHYSQPPPPPPPPQSVHYSQAPPPPPQSVHYAPTQRSSSPSRHEHFEERIEESNHIGGPLTVVVPEERRMVRSERDIKDEIRQLEVERRMLKYERDSDYEVIERREPRREVVRVDKDRKGRKKPDPKVVAAMMATLS